MSHKLKLIAVSYVLFPVLVLGLSGCQKNPLGLAPVNGTVTLDNEVVSGATVTFHPVSADGLVASGRTENDGTFVLNTAGGGDVMGAKPGEYLVTIVKKEGFYGEIAPRSAEQQSGKPAEYIPTPAAAPKSESLLPKKYGNKDTSELKVNVTKGKNVCTFALTKQ